MNGEILRLRRLGPGYRAGLSLLLLVLLGGLVASAAHLATHHARRDERPGLSLEDLTGAYHGVRTTAPLLSSLERGHPEELPEAERALLLTWLGGTRISDDYDNLDLGDAAPAEVLDARCLSCHARNATEGDGIGQELPLEYWDDIERVAFSREINPTDEEILLASTHTHALSMGLLSIVTALMGLATRWPRRLLGVLVFLNGLALFCDLGCWWLARSSAALVPLLATAGALWGASLALLLLLILAEMWLPDRSGA